MEDARVRMDDMAPLPEEDDDADYDDHRAYEIVERHHQNRETTGSVFGNTIYADVDDVDSDCEGLYDTVDALPLYDTVDALPEPDYLPAGPLQLDEPARMPSTTSHRLEDRDAAMAKLVEKETGYVDKLQVLVDKFLPCLQRSKKFKLGSISTIFSNIAELLAVHKGFLEQLERAVDSHNGRNVSGPFRKYHGDMIAVYNTFCRQSVRANKKLDKHARTHERTLDQARKESGQSLSLSELLKLPMKHVTKYPRYIADLLKATPEGHTSHKPLTKTLRLVKKLKEHVDTTNKDQLKLNGVLQRVNKVPRQEFRDEQGQGFSNKLQQIAPILKKGALRVRRDPKKEMKDAYAFLFQKGLLLCKRNGTQLEYREIVDFTTKMDIDDVTARQATNAGVRGGDVWSLKTQVKDIWFQADGEKDEWMECMRNCSAFRESWCSFWEGLKTSNGESAVNAWLVKAKDFDGKGSEFQRKVRPS